MQKLITEILTKKSSRNKKFLKRYLAITFNAGQPWG